MMAAGQGADDTAGILPRGDRADNCPALFVRGSEMWVALRMIVACGLVAAGVSGVCAETSPYAGEQNRGLKALSEHQIEDLRDGRGMAMALAAELNSYPGPAHVLELASALDLSEAQRGRTQALFEEMQKTAVPLGNEILAKEMELDQAFASGRIDDARLHRIVADIGRLQGELRYTHLKYHLAMRGVLSSDQIAAYDRLRGYNSTQAPAPGMHGRHSH
jgi:Spy/CpxP family protein refolding chaperone